MELDDFSIQGVKSILSNFIQKPFIEPDNAVTVVVSELDSDGGKIVPSGGDATLKCTAQSKSAVLINIFFRLNINAIFPFYKYKIPSLSFHFLRNRCSMGGVWLMPKVTNYLRSA